MGMFGMAALGLSLLAAGPALSGPAVERALANYRALVAGQKQLADLPAQERIELFELDRWLRAQDGSGGPSETRQACAERLATARPSRLESALIDLKCSQRPERTRGR